jgi:hypothetical protein
MNQTKIYLNKSKYNCIIKNALTLVNGEILLLTAEASDN